MDWAAVVSLLGPELALASSPQKISYYVSCSDQKPRDHCKQEDPHQNHSFAVESDPGLMSGPMISIRIRRANSSIEEEDMVLP